MSFLWLVDLGGGTFDVSLLQSFSRAWSRCGRPPATAGSAARDFVDAIVATFMAGPRRGGPACRRPRNQPIVGALPAARAEMAKRQP